MQGDSPEYEYKRRLREHEVRSNRLSYRSGALPDTWRFTVKVPNPVCAHCEAFRAPMYEVPRQPCAKTGCICLFCEHSRNGSVPCLNCYVTYRSFGIRLQMQSEIFTGWSSRLSRFKCYDPVSQFQKNIMTQREKTAA